MREHIAVRLFLFPIIASWRRSVLVGLRDFQEIDNIPNLVATISQPNFLPMQDFGITAWHLNRAVLPSYLYDSLAVATEALQNARNLLRLLVLLASQGH